MSVITFDFNEDKASTPKNMMQELRQNFYQEVYERNIINAFGSLCEAGYEFKFRNVVWESDHESEATSFVVDESQKSENEFRFDNEQPRVSADTNVLHELMQAENDSYK